MLLGICQALIVEPILFYSEHGIVQAILISGEEMEILLLETVGDWILIENERVQLGIIFHLFQNEMLL